jgi:hypothetical protein
MNKKIVLKIIGVLFLVLGISAIVNTIYQNTKYDVGLASVLWFCYIGMILLGIGVLRRNQDMTLAQFNILAIPLLFWNFDFFYYLAKGQSLLGVVDYYFLPGPLIGKIISSQHLFTIPLVLISIYLIGLKSKDVWKLSFLELAIVFFVTRLATNPVENVNCVFRNCANFNFGFLPYWIEWFIAMFFLVFITNWIVSRIFIRQ